MGKSSTGRFRRSKTRDKSESEIHEDKRSFIDLHHPCRQWKRRRIIDQRKRSKVAEVKMEVENGWYIGVVVVNGPVHLSSRK